MQNFVKYINFSCYILKNDIDKQCPTGNIEKMSQIKENKVKDATQNTKIRSKKFTKNLYCLYDNEGMDFLQYFSVCL